MPPRLDEASGIASACAASRHLALGLRRPSARFPVAQGAPGASDSQAPRGAAGRCASAGARQAPGRRPRRSGPRSREPRTPSAACRCSAPPSRSTAGGAAAGRTAQLPRLALGLALGHELRSPVNLDGLDRERHVRQHRFEEPLRVPRRGAGEHPADHDAADRIDRPELLERLPVAADRHTALRTALGHERTSGTSAGRRHPPRLARLRRFSHRPAPSSARGARSRAGRWRALRGNGLSSFAHR